MLQPGDQVLAQSASGEIVERRAVGSVVDGRDFPVVWLCTEGEWQAARAAGREPASIPWPADDVRPAGETTS